MPDRKLTDLGSLLAITPANMLLYVVDTSEAVLANKSKKLAYTLVEAYNDVRYASAAQGVLASTALQPAAIGVTVQAWDADLDTLAGLAKTDGNFIVGDGAAWVVESGATARTSLGLGSLAVINDAPSDGSQYARQNGAWAVVAAAGVTSVFARTGAVVAASGDYTASQVTNVPAGGIAAVTVQAALNELDTEKAAIASLATVATTGAYADLSGTPTLGTLAALNSPLPIINGGSGQTTQQAAIDALTNVAVATNEHVLTKDTATGNAIFKTAAGGSSLPVADTQTIVMGSADNTKLLRFEVDGFTTGTTRILTPPNANATIAGLEVANIFTTNQKVNVNSTTAFFVEQDGVKDNVLVVDTTNGRVGVLTAPATYNFEVIGVTDAATAIFNSSSAAVGTRVVIQGTAANSNSGVTDPILSLRNRLGNQVACIREDGLTVSSFLGTIDDNSVMLVDSSGAAAAYPRGINIGSSSIVGWGSGNWYFTKDVTLSRLDAAKLALTGIDSATNSVTQVATIRHNTSGTPGAGFGSSLYFEGESSTTENQSMGRFIYEWVTATHASRKARSKWTVYDTAEREGIRIEADGSAPMLGFLGASAIARQAHIVDADGTLADITTKFNSLLAYLENFGFIATS